MPSLEDRVRFAETYVTTPDGQPFSLEGRRWIVDEFWRPLDGFKFWPVDKTRLCAECASKANTITDGFYDADETRAQRHAAENDGCRGLTCEPILLVVLSLRRQSGKTTATSAYILSEIFKEDHEDIAFIASSEKQSARLFDEHYADPIRHNEKLSSRADIIGQEIFVPKKHSRFEYLSSSHSNVTGGTRTKNVVDEARDVAARTVMALIPTTFARGGWRCRSGHIRTHGGINDPDAPKNCPVCSAKLEPWFARILIMSSAAVLDGSDDDWFAELVETLRTTPDPNAHLFEAEGTVNPKVSAKNVEMVQRIFGAMKSTRALADVETNNEFRFKGEDFLAENEVKRVIDPTLTNKEFGQRPCVAFLDTSKTRELTSLVITEDDEPPELDEDAPLWKYLAVCHIKIWEPASLPGRVIDEGLVLEYLDTYVPLFPLRSIRVDTRLMPWAVRLVQKCKNERPWGHLVDGVTWKDAERDASWTLFEQRILAETIRLPDNPQLRAELRAARRVDLPDNRVSIREANRRKKHLDVAEGVAACCYMVHLESLTQRRGFSMKQVAERLSSGKKVVDVLQRAKRPITRGFGPNSY